MNTQKYFLCIKLIIQIYRGFSVYGIVVSGPTFQNTSKKPVCSIIKIGPFLLIRFCCLCQQIAYFMQYIICVSITVHYYYYYHYASYDAAHSPPSLLHFCAFNHLFSLSAINPSLFCLMSVVDSL